jgi:prefoldin subunit 5
MEEPQISVADLLRKIGSLVVQIEMYQAKVAMLEERIANLTEVIAKEENSNS